MYVHRTAKLLRGRRRRIAIGALLALSVLATAFMSSASARPRHHGGQAPLKPTIVLIHGAWADSSSWNGVVRRLQARGYTVDVPSNPLRGLPGDSDYVASFLHTISGPIVLVGHSYGGAVITNAATGNAQVKALVYIDAFAPDQGETIGQLDAAQPGSELGGDPSAIFTAVPYVGGPVGDVDLYIKQTVFASAIANDLPSRRAAVLAATQRPLALSAFGEASGIPAWKTIPSWYLVGTLDHAIPPAEQRFMAQRMHAHTIEIPASHLSMISHPDAVTGLIVSAALGTR